jgi:pre-mRNA-splicing factor CDC5/CEF1
LLVNDGVNINTFRLLQDIEAALMKRDEEKLQEKQKLNQPAAVAKALELNDVAMMRRRGKMMLPAPQVSEAELEAIARGGAEADVDPELVEGAGGEATRRLLGDYQTPRG